jgi:hypothetical protein
MRSQWDWEAVAGPLASIPDEAKVWMWWSALIMATACNLLFFVYVELRERRGLCEANRYRRYMKWLAVPTVVQCGYRSVFPEVYTGDCAVDAPGCRATRLVFFDHPANGILVNRGLAAVGELCFVLQIALALRAVNEGLRGASMRSSLVHLASWLVVCLIVAAELCSYACTATTVNLCVGRSFLLGEVA